MFRKLANVRALGHGTRTWAAPRYLIPGVSPSHPAFNLGEVAYDEGFHVEEHGDYVRAHGRRQLVEPTITRQARIASQFSSLAALPSFQSFANLNWSNGLAGVIARPDHPAINVNWNRNQQGSKEQQRGTSYDPWPAAGALYPKVI